MTRARDFADVISGNFDLPAGALDNAGSGDPVGFSAYGSSGWLNITTLATVSFGFEHFDDGSGYNTSTSQYQPPSDGLYFFSWSVYLQFNGGNGDNNNFVECYLRKNTEATKFGGRLLFGYQNHGDWDGNIIGHCLMDLTTQDTVEVKIVESGSGSPRYYGANSSFCGLKVK